MALNNILEPNQNNLYAKSETLLPTNPNPGGATTLWSNSSDGNKLYYGNSAISGGLIIAGGTFIPVFTQFSANTVNYANVFSQYSRIGNMVIVSSRFTIQLTSANSSIAFTTTVPVTASTNVGTTLFAPFVTLLTSTGASASLNMWATTTTTTTTIRLTTSVLAQNTVYTANFFYTYSP